VDKKLNLARLTHFPTLINKRRRLTISDDAPLKVMTYNIWNFNPDWPSRLSKIVEEVKEARPDIVAFEEVRYRFMDPHGNRGTFQVEEIAQLLGYNYQYYYQHSMTYLDGNTFHEDEGNAIFSIHTIRETDFIRLSRDLEDGEDDHQRIVTRVMVDTPSLGNINMHSSHLSLSHRSRKRTVVELWKYFEKHFEQNNYPQILVGDMNAEPNDIFIRFLIGKEQLNDLSGNMIDAWDYLYPNDKGYTFPTYSPIKRIDFVLYRGLIKPLSASILGQQAPRETMSSDHLPLLVDFANLD